MQIREVMDLDLISADFCFLQRFVAVEVERARVEERLLRRSGCRSGSSSAAIVCSCTKSYDGIDSEVPNDTIIPKLSFVPYQRNSLSFQIERLH